MTARREELLAGAQEIAAKGLRVAPLFNPAGDGKNCSCATPNCDSPAKHPRIPEWTKSATTDAATITGWWSRWPDSNVGIATGSASGVFVLDADDSHALQKFAHIYGDIPDTLTALTGRGKHLYFKHPGFKVLTKKGFQKTAGIDIRGDGGLVVAPPSMHYTGALYEWIDQDMPIAEAPSWLVELLKMESELEGQRLLVIPAGKLFLNDRRRAIFELSAALHEKGNGLQPICRMMQSFNRRKCDPELDRAEVVQLVGHAVTFVEASGTKEDRFSRRKSLLPWSQNRPADSLTNPYNFSDYQRGWQEYCRDQAWINGGILPVLPTDMDGLFRLVRGSHRKRFMEEIPKLLSDSGFSPEEFEDGNHLVHQEMAEEWADSAIKWLNKSIASKFNKTKKMGSHSGSYDEAA